MSWSRLGTRLGISVRVSYARKIEPGKTYAFSRRVVGRFFLFRPDEDGTTQRIFCYLLAHIAAKHGVLIHAFVLMSTHFHIVCTDTRGVMPTFAHAFDSMLAMCTKAHRGWSDEVFDAAQPAYVEIRTVRALIAHLAYVIANPVSAGIVRYATEWRGALSRVAELGRGRFGAVRPTVYLDPKRWPAQASLALTSAPMCEGIDVREAVQLEVEAIERATLRAMRARGRAFVGASRAMRIDVETRATAEERSGERKPTFAARDVDAARQAVEELRAFREAYRRALDAWRRGAREVLFPRGTWWMRVFHACACA